MKQVCLSETILTEGFSVGTGQTAYAVVDSRLRQKYQAEPGRQEWITVVECICTDGEVIPPLVIFKGENLLTNWLPRDFRDNWHFASNSQGWTSNIHGEMWLEKCFHPATVAKANGRKRLLICDGHDSHISAPVVRYCIDHDIILFLLLPHSSHLLQPLDVGVFSPLKRAMSLQLSRLYATEISRLQKVEWVEHYAQARSIAITSQNVLAGWRGSGISPLNPHRVLRSLSNDPGISLSSIPENSIATSSFLITSSPPDATVLRNTNATFSEAMRNASLSTPIRNHGRRLSGISEQLHAENSILRAENKELKKVLNARKTRLSGKRLVLKGKVVVSTEELQQKLAEAEKSTRERKRTGHKNKRQRTIPVIESDNGNMEEEIEAVGDEIGDCIVVQFA